jgi:hypothetical protein
MTYAHRNWQERRPGYYVVNPRTRIAVAYFKDRDRAEAEADHRNRTRPIAPDPLTVEHVSEPSP